ncbi:MAG: hypothetical protein BM564_03540 [Bacteroidetes bacterium MedPE-SWsnd-G2]|nr:MAG: hypothetical protein BM564_03540 [Bacteroidetes bacterium MedPE-SWsnd-G2]
MHIHFSEKQRFNQWWLILLFIGLALIPLVGVYKQLILGQPFGDKPMSDSGLIIYAVLTFLFILGFQALTLKTKITSRSIAFQFYPFVKKEISWNEVKSAKLINYGFVGGWGIRLWTKYGTVYNVKGTKGLAIELNNGKKLVIGTQKSDTLQFVLKKIDQFNTRE